MTKFDIPYVESAITAVATVLIVFVGVAGLRGCMLDEHNARVATECIKAKGTWIAGKGCSFSEVPK